MRIINTIEDARVAKAKPQADRIPVIVLTAISRNRSQYGLQYWTAEMIEAGHSENADRTVSFYVEHN